jgi:hypothetical protein
VQLRETRAVNTPLLQDPAPDPKAEREKRIARAERARITASCAWCTWKVSGTAKEVTALQVEHRLKAHGIDLPKRSGGRGGTSLTPAQSRAKRHLTRSAEREV